MRTSAKLTALLAVCGAVCTWGVGFASPADANEWLTLGKEGWIPSVSAFGGATIQDQEATAESACEKGGPGFDPTPGSGIPQFASCIGLPQPDENGFVDEDLFVPGPGVLRPEARGNDYAISPILGFDVQLLTPTLHAIPGGPRLFVRGEVQLTFGSTRSIANQGDPSGTNLGPNNPNPESRPASSLAGIGSRTVVETQTLGWGAVAGIAFPFEFLGRRLWLKPGAAWTRYGVDVEGIVEAGIKNDPADPSSIPMWGDQLRVISLRGSKSATFNGIGPSLELEMDVGQFGPLGVSLFLGGAVYKILGDRSISFSDSVSFEMTAPSAPQAAPDLPPFRPRSLPEDTNTARWTFEVQPWLIRSAVGFRLHWYGF